MPQPFLDLAPAPRFAVVVFALLSLATLLVALLGWWIFRRYQARFVDYI